MLKYFIYLKFYHQNIQKLSYNERLLCYLEAMLETNGFDPRKRKYFTIFYLN